MTTSSAVRSASEEPTIKIYSITDYISRFEKKPETIAVSKVREFLNDRNAGRCFVSILEYLNHDRRRFYVDVDGGINSIEELVTRLFKFLDMPNSNCVITENSGSRHGEMTYHIFFSFSANRKVIKNLLRDFIVLYPEYQRAIDLRIYDNDRLFRIPFSCKLKHNESEEVLYLTTRFKRLISNRGGENNIDVNDKHIIQGRFKLCEDKLEECYYEFEDCLIQNIFNIPKLKKKPKPREHKETTTQVERRLVTAYAPKRQVVFHRLINALVE